MTTSFSGGFVGPHRQRPFDPKRCWWCCVDCEVWWKGDPECWQCGALTERWSNYVGGYDGMQQTFAELPDELEAGTVL